MNMVDVKRLAKMDEQIMELEYLYTREVMREKELNKRNLLVSNGYKYRIDNLRRARARLKASIVSAPTKRMLFSITLAEKKAKVEEATQELEYLKKSYQNLMAQVMLTKDDNIAQQALDLASEIKKQQARINGYERAVFAFCEHGDKQVSKQLNSRKYKNHDAELDASQILAEEPKTEYRTIESILGNDPNWNLKAENNAGELFMPKQRVVIDFDE
jgi:wyosine [tRNA(Phe)-imidazoG37] synthetase (radical SAM superfamily)